MANWLVVAAQDTDQQPRPEQGGGQDFRSPARAGGRTEARNQVTERGFDRLEAGRLRGRHADTLRTYAARRRSAEAYPPL